MAFDMYLDKERVFINYDEEIIFNLINEDDDYPKLNWLWENYYDSPLIGFGVAEQLASELSLLASNIGNSNNEKAVRKICKKLSVFFNRAYVSGKQIKCYSD